MLTKSSKRFHIIGLGAKHSLLPDAVVFQLDKTPIDVDVLGFSAVNIAELGMLKGGLPFSHYKAARKAIQKAYKGPDNGWRRLVVVTR